jgi:energy-coupling factor transporter transmembrane protein EcfT
MTFSYIPAKSFLHSLDARTKLIAFFVITFSAVQITDPIVMGSMLAVVIILSLSSHIPPIPSVAATHFLLHLQFASQSVEPEADTGPGEDTVLYDSFHEMGANHWRGHGLLFGDAL